MKKQSQKKDDVADLMMKVQEQLAALEKKLDILVHRSLTQTVEAKPAPKPFYQPFVNAQSQGGGGQQDFNKERRMFRAMCADCKKECEVPFRPSGDRPVYCKECFARRKGGNNFKSAADFKPHGAPSLSAAVPAPVHVPESPEKKKRPAAAKRSGGKKKPFLKKKKK